MRKRVARHTCGVNDMKTVIVYSAIIIGLFFLGLAALYWMTPADNLPAFLPGYDPASTKPHLKHAFGMLVIGLVAFAAAWFRGRAD
jgi:hypothetical protein